MGSFLSLCPACSIQEPPPLLNKMDHIESQGLRYPCEQNSLPPPTRLLGQMGSCPHLEGRKSRWGCLKELLSLSLPVASVLTSPSQEAVQEFVKKQSHLSMSHPGMLQWLNLATGRCQQNPQVTSGHGPQATSCPP